MREYQFSTGSLFDGDVAGRLRDQGLYRISGSCGALYDFVPVGVLGHPGSFFRANWSPKTVCTICVMPKVPIAQRRNVMK